MIERHSDYPLPVWSVATVEWPGIPRHKAELFRIFHGPEDLEGVEDTNSLLIILGPIHSQM